MIRTLFGVVVLATAALLIPGGEVRAEKKKLELKVLYQASNDDEKLEVKKPANGVITTQKEFDDLFTAWKLGDQKPMIDFKKDMVLVSTTVGSRLSMLATLDTDTGDLQVGGIATRDLRPGFRYIVGLAPREGVKTVNRKDLPKE